MSNIKKLNDYDLKDATAREEITALDSAKADKSTTLAGYGITDAYTKTESDSRYVLTETLWTNADPTSAFEGQTVTVSNDLTTYDKIEILMDIFVPYENYSFFETKYSSYQVPITEVIYDNEEIYVRERNITFPSTTTITFDDCYQNDEVQNTRLVPLKIIGYKNI